MRVYKKKCLPESQTKATNALIPESSRARGLCIDPRWGFASPGPSGTKEHFFDRGCWQAAEEVLTPKRLCCRCKLTSKQAKQTKEWYKKKKKKKIPTSKRVVGLGAACIIADKKKKRLSHQNQCLTCSSLSRLYATQRNMYFPWHSRLKVLVLTMYAVATWNFLLLHNITWSKQCSVTPTRSR